MLKEKTKQVFKTCLVYLIVIKLFLGHLRKEMIELRNSLDSF